MSSSKTKKVLIAIPSRGWIHQTVLTAIIRIFNDGRYEKTILTPPVVSCVSIELARQSIQYNFLKGDYDYLLSIDSDNAPVGNPLDLIELDKDVIGCVTPTWYYSKVRPETTPSYPIRWNAYDYKHDKSQGKMQYLEHFPQSGLQKVDAIGTGCFLVARRVFEALKDAKWNMIALEDGSPFKGEDIIFCETVREKGFEIYAHFDYPCIHFNELELSTIRQGFTRYYGESKKL